MRIAANCIGGPLDGQVFSIDEEQTEIAGMGAMGEHEKYVRSKKPLKDASDADVEGFDGHGIEQTADFIYDEGVKKK